MPSQDFLMFIDRSPTPWHAVLESKALLEQAGFKEIFEKDSWLLKPGGKYFFVRQGTSLCAFIIPTHPPKRFQIAAAHTDSPGFKLKPHAEYTKNNMIMLGLEVYGAPILVSWLNRDLGIAGRVVCKEQGAFCERLVRFEESPIVIPQLAIHLDRSVNESGALLNKQEQLAAIAGLQEDDKTSFLESLLKKQVQGEIVGWDLFVYPIEKARNIGWNEAMISGYRLDNLSSVHAVLEGILSAEPSEDSVSVAVFWNHEEIGSGTSQGAGSPLLAHTLERIAGSRDEYFKLLTDSLCVSIDAAHGTHPNYSDKHEPRHPVLLNQGIVLKTSAQYRYATDALSAARIVDLCRTHRLPLQTFVSRGDIPSGSTIGPIAASLTGMPTVDIGIPMLSMHASRELVGSHDQEFLTSLMRAYL